MSSTANRNNDRMSSSDTLLWTIGRDPVLRTTIVAVLVLDQAPCWEDLRSRVGALVDLMPHLRSRAKAGPPLGWGRPRWVGLRDFDLDLHFRRMVAPSPATLRTVLDLAQTMGTTGFDPELPLWEAVVVEGIEDGGAAVIVKLHHAVADGVGGMALILRLVDRQREPSARSAATAAGTAEPPHDECTTPEAGRPGDWWRAGPWRTARASLGLLGATGRAVVDPVAGLRQARRTAVSVARLLAPARQPMSPTMTGRSTGRYFAVLDLPSDALRAAATATGATVNDIFVTGILGGLRRYHERHGVDVPELRVLMPINVRSDSDGAGGNHFVPARFALSTVGDPGERLRQVRQVTGAWKHAPGLGLSDVLASGLDLLPPPLTVALWGSMLKGDDFVATNVPGPPFETYLGGAHVERLYAFAPASGAAVNVALTSAGDRASLGINVDTLAVPDGPSLARCLEDGLSELIAAGAEDGSCVTGTVRPRGSRVGGEKVHTS